MGIEIVMTTCPNCGAGFPVRGPRSVVSCPKCGRNVTLGGDVKRASPPAPAPARAGEPGEAHKAIFQCLGCGHTYEWIKGRTSVPVCPACDSSKSVARTPIAAVVAGATVNKTKARVIKLIRSSFHQLTEVRRKIQELRTALSLVGFQKPDLDALLLELLPSLDNADHKVEAFLNARFHDRLEKMGLSKDEDSIKAWIRSSS